MKRNILSVIAGLAAAVITFLIAESVNHPLHPIPSNLNYNDNAAVKSFYENQALSFWAVILLGWSLGSFLCGFLIKLLSKNNNKKLPIIAGSILILSAISNFLLLPHPTWFIIIGLLVFIPFTLLGHKSYKLKTI